MSYMLFSGETRLTSPIKGTSGFAREFEKTGPRDPQGRSLRTFDMQTRMFRYPCSYMIYSDAFDAMPAVAKDRIYRRMWEVLSGKDTSAPFAHLPPPIESLFTRSFALPRRACPHIGIS